MPPYVPPDPGSAYAAVVPRNGIDLLHDPFWNKGTAFSAVERDRLKLRGLLPPRHSASIEAQAARIMDDVESGQLFYDPAALGPDAGVDAEDVRRWKLLDNLATRNTTLFYKVLLSDFARFQRVVYTPTIAWACLNYHKLYRSPRGLYFSADDAGEVLASTYNWPSREVDAIVITDGSRVLGLGAFAGRGGRGRESERRRGRDGEGGRGDERDERGWAAGAGRGGGPRGRGGGSG